MSEFRIEVVRVGPVEKHPNADALEMTNANGYPVLFRTGQFKEGDPAVYVPVDAIVPDDPRWAFLAGHRRIRAKRLRGIFSMGLLTEADPLWTEGQDVRQELGIEKYEPSEEKTWRAGLSASPPPTNWSIYDLEGLRRLSSILIPGEEVVITEKIHGANARFTFQDGKLHIGSHRQWKKEADEDMWWRAARLYPGLAELARYEGWTLYGEVYGDVQDLKYGCQKGELRLVCFDVRDPYGAWGSWSDLAALSRIVEVPLVPILYRGPWEEELRALAEGPTVLGAAHTREGIVVQPVVPRFEPRVGGNLKLKFVGEGYLLRKGA